MRVAHLVVLLWFIAAIASPAHAQSTINSWSSPTVALPGKRLDIAIRINTPARLAYLSTDDALLDPSLVFGAYGQCSGAGRDGVVCNIDGEDYRRLIVRLVPRLAHGCGDVLTLRVELDDPASEPETVQVPLACERVLVPLLNQVAAAAD